MIHSRALLAREVAKLIASSSIAEGDRLFEAGEDAPDGAALHDQIARAQYARRERAKQAEWDAATTYNEDDARATAAAFAALRAAQGMTE
jgi:hypothetical protein